MQRQKPYYVKHVPLTLFRILPDAVGFQRVQKSPQQVQLSPQRVNGSGSVPNMSSKDPNGSQTGPAKSQKDLVQLGSQAGPNRVQYSPQ